MIDPAGGSWYVEDLTEQLALKAWAWFQEIELLGRCARRWPPGSSPASGGCQPRMPGRDALARRREAITGVSQFPVIGETLLSSALLPRPADSPGWSAAHPLVAVARGAPRPRRRPRPGHRVAADAHPGAA